MHRTEPTHPDELRYAARCLEGHSFASRAAALLGRQVEVFTRSLPGPVRRLAGRVTEGALRTALRAALRTIDTEATPRASRGAHKAAAAASGAIGGAFGLASTAIEPGANTIATHSAQIGDLTFALDQTIAIGMMTSFSTSRFALVVRGPHAVDVLDAKQKIVGRVTLEGSDIQLSFPTLGLGARARVHPGRDTRPRTARRGSRRSHEWCAAPPWRRAASRRHRRP